MEWSLGVLFLLLHVTWIISISSETQEQFRIETWFRANLDWYVKPPDPCKYNPLLVQLSIKYMRLYKLFERYIKYIHTEYQYFHLPWQAVMTLVSHMFNQVKLVFKVFCCFCYLSLWSFPSYRYPHSRTSELRLGSELKFINIWSHQINVYVSRFLSWCNSVFITCVDYIHTRKDVSDIYTCIILIISCTL